MGRTTRSDLSFDAFFQEVEEDMQRMRREMDRLFEAATSHAATTGGATPLVWGYHMEVGPDGVPHAETFGNAGGTAKDLTDGWREPFTTFLVDERKNVVRITAELPGVRKEQIRVEATPDRVFISAEGDPWKYRKELQVPGSRLDPDSVETQYRNGLLEVTVKVAGSSNGTSKKGRSK